MNNYFSLFTLTLQLGCASCVLAMEPENELPTGHPPLMTMDTLEQQTGAQVKRKWDPNDKQEATEQEATTEQETSVSEPRTLYNMPHEILVHILSFLKNDDKVLYGLLPVNSHFMQGIEDIFKNKAKEKGYVPIIHENPTRYRGEDVITLAAARPYTRFYAAHDSLRLAWGLFMKESAQHAQSQLVNNPSFSELTLRQVSCYAKGVSDYYPDSYGARFLNCLLILISRDQYLLGNQQSLEVITKDIFRDDYSKIWSPPHNIYEEGIPAWLIYSLLHIAPTWEQLKHNHKANLPIDKKAKSAMDFGDSPKRLSVNLARLQLFVEAHIQKARNPQAPLPERLKAWDWLIKYDPSKTLYELRTAAKDYRSAYESAEEGSEDKQKYFARLIALEEEILRDPGKTLDDVREIAEKYRYAYEFAKEGSEDKQNYLARLIALGEEILRDPGKTLDDVRRAARYYRFAYKSAKEGSEDKQKYHACFIALDNVINEKSPKAEAVDCFNRSYNSAKEGDKVSSLLLFKKFLDDEASSKLKLNLLPDALDIFEQTWEENKNDPDYHKYLAWRQVQLEPIEYLRAPMG